MRIHRDRVMEDQMSAITRTLETLLDERDSLVHESARLQQELRQLRQVVHGDEDSLACQICALKEVITALTRENLELREAAKLKDEVSSGGSGRGSGGGNTAPTLATAAGDTAATSAEALRRIDADFRASFGDGADASLDASFEEGVPPFVQRNAPPPQAGFDTELAEAKREVEGLKKALDERTKALVFWSTKGQSPGMSPGSSPPGRLHHQKLPTQPAAAKSRARVPAPKEPRPDRA